MEFYLRAISSQFFRSPKGSLTRDDGIKIDRVNNGIITKIIKSKRFVQMMDKYVNTELVQEQREEIQRKFFTLVKKWKKLMDEDVDLFMSICQVIEQDPKFKTPWTVQEVIDALNMFYKNFGIQKILR